MLVEVADDSKALPIGPACTNVHNILSPVLVHVMSGSNGARRG